MSEVVTIIPTRLKSTRLPNKILLDVNGKSVLQRVIENVKKYVNSDIYISTEDQEIVKESKKCGIEAILTPPSLPSGTDSIAFALSKLDPKNSKYDIVVNFQGDGINVNPSVNFPLIKIIEEGNCDIATCGMIFKNKEDSDNPTNVKIVMGLKENEKIGRCLYFTRAPNCPWVRDLDKTKNKDLYHHIGIYVYTTDALKKMVSLPIGVLEEREKLEQLRALENGMIIKAKFIEETELKLNQNAPADINTIDELILARKYIK